ncbi:MAG: M14 family metallopeptidase, partial [Chitinophagaceae bacterium]|nr:M14 family metallopeptidase [Chitinophagaceae bacterium]
MRKIMIAFSILLSVVCNAQLPVTRYETSKGKETVTYYEAIAAWKQMDKVSPNVQMLTMGSSDAGEPLHLVLVSSDGTFTPQQWKAKNKVVLLINNGIHPGEPDGIDASILLVKDIVSNKLKLPSNVVLAIIPVYNIGGSLNRTPYYRIDQNGPVEKGSRGNSQNLDLNRDFIKCDSREARGFAEIFHFTQPDIFIDNHVSNGADYQHVMTLLTTQHNKLGGVMGEYLNKTFEPAIYKSMKEKGYDLIPYVNNFGDKPENGWGAYWDGPRYSSGYTALFGTFSFVPETHMLKPYPQRVEATYKLMQSFIEFATGNASTIKQLRKQQLSNFITQQQFPFGFTADRTKFTELTYKGYAAEQKPSNISGLPRLYYNHEKPFEVTMKFYNFFTPKTIIEKPTAYIIPQGWWKVIDLLKLNKIQMRALSRDTTIEVEVYTIEDYKSSPRPYEWHHINTDVKTNTTVQQIKFRKGDWYIPMNQTANHFLMQVLEPTGDDSYFTWNFFDPILAQKEGYSAYVFEEKAEAFLQQNPAVKEKLEQRRATDTAFAKNGRAQLNFVYQNSLY